MLENILCTIKTPSRNTTLGLLAHTVNTYIKLVYHHLGEKLTNLPYGKRSTIERAIVAEYNREVAEALVCPSQNFEEEEI